MSFGSFLFAKASKWSGCVWVTITKSKSRKILSIETVKLTIGFLSIPANDSIAPFFENMGSTKMVFPSYVILIVALRMSCMSINVFIIWIWLRQIREDFRRKSKIGNLREIPTRTFYNSLLNA